MNNDLEQFSEERLKEISELTGAYEEWSPSQDEIHALARIALAAKQANPDYYIVRLDNVDAWGSDIDLTSFEDELSASKCKDDHGGVIIPCYTTPQPAHTEQDGWIKCSERMPDVGSSVLVVIQGKYVHKGHYSQWTGAKTEKGRKPRFEDLRGILRYVTHWMPLPQPPRES